MLRMLRLFALFSTVVPSVCLAESLRISPESCVNQNSCSIKLMVSWQLAQTKNVCIQILPAGITRCQANTKEGSFSLPLVVKQTQTITLVHQNTSEVIAMKTFEYFKQEHKSRKRQRYVWSILR